MLVRNLKVLPKSDACYRYIVIIELYFNAQCPHFPGVGGVPFKFCQHVIGKSANCPC